MTAILVLLIGRRNSVNRVSRTKDGGHFDANFSVSCFRSVLREAPCWWFLQASASATWRVSSYQHEALNKPFDESIGGVLHWHLSPTRWIEFRRAQLHHHVIDWITHHGASPIAFGTLCHFEILFLSTSWIFFMHWSWDWRSFTMMEMFQSLRQLLNFFKPYDRSNYPPWASPVGYGTFLLHYYIHYFTA